MKILTSISSMIAEAAGTVETVLRTVNKTAGLAELVVDGTTVEMKLEIDHNAKVTAAKYSIELADIDVGDTKGSAKAA
jgi:hypothetical protein